jgi:hypothetical protein
MLTWCLATLDKALVSACISLQIWASILNATFGGTLGFLPWAAFIDVISASTCRHHHTPG